MKVKIKFLKMRYLHGRQIAWCQLVSEDEATLLLDGSLAQILMTVKDQNYEIVNSQEILMTLVITFGFSA